MYDEARFRSRLGLAQKAQTFAQIAGATLAKLRAELDLGCGKSVCNTYITCIEKYFLPYFGDKQLESIKHTDVIDFELWRNRQMQRLPKASTLNNFASA
jgi:integrase